MVFKVNLKANEVYHYLAPSDAFLFIVSLDLIHFSSDEDFNPID